MEQDKRLFKPGTLWLTLLEQTTHAQRCGAIQTISTTPEIIQQSGVKFQVRVMKTLAMKALAAATQKDIDPFLPYDPDLFVAEVSKTHVALLNKFNVVEPHLLIVTRAFEPQEALLTLEDCEALIFCLAEFDGLGFYNAGTAAGASQRHKHLQLIPFSALAQSQLPIESQLHTVIMNNHTGIVPGFPFLHAYAPMNPTWLSPRMEGAQSLLTCYYSLRRAVGWSAESISESSTPSPPYNLLVTRKWLLFVPRSQEFFEDISINALGFAGMFLVTDTKQLALLQKHGPMTALQHVAFPSES